jgi:Uri superfamily endonuclease
VGKLGEHQFLKGYYAYTGSALGPRASSLRKRVARHLQKKKRVFWHVDYLLTSGEPVVIAIVADHTNMKMECEINRRLKNEVTARIPVLGFGASDCKENCGSHLLYLGEKNVEHRIALLYDENFGSKSVVANF